MGKSIVNFLKAIWGFLCKKKEYDPDIIAAKRKAVEKFCELQKRICKECWLYYKVPWYDECYYSDEDVDQSYELLYGNKDPKELESEMNQNDYH